MKKNFVIGFLVIICFCILSLVVISLFDNGNSHGELVKVSYNDIVSKVDNNEDFILVVSQSTCSHCATYKPKLIEIAKEYNIDIFYIDYNDENSDTQVKFLKEFNLSGATPTTLFIKDGKEASLLNRLEGDLSSTKVVEKFKKMGFISE